MEGGIGYLQPVAGGGEPLHLDFIPAVEGSHQDSATYVAVVGCGAQQAIQHGTDTTELHPGLMGGVDEE